MSFRATLIWLGLAAVLFGVVCLVHWHEAGRSAAPPPGAFPAITASKIQAVQVRPGKGLEIRAVRTNGGWALTKPLEWPAQNLSIDQFLSGLENVVPSAFITAAEMRARPTADREYGFHDPQASVILEWAQGGLHLRAGAMTAPGDQFFVQVVGTEGAYVLPADFLKLIPSGVNDWRDRSLLNLNRLEFDRINVTNAGKVLSLQRVPEGTWRLVSPIRARADQNRIHDALEKIHSLRIQEFVTDEPGEDLESFALEPARLDLCLASGTNVVAHLQFGSSTSNLVYARKSDWRTVVNVQSEFVSDWQRPVADFRDPFVLSVTEPVVSIAMDGKEPFEVIQQTNGAWQIAPSNFPGDPDLVKEFIVALSALGIEQFVKDVVTPPDLPPYGLDAPRRRCFISFPTNSVATNAIELQFGLEQEGRVFVRRADEDSVYAIPAAQARALPDAPWRLRHRRLWDFPLKDVKAVVFRNEGQARRMIREGENDWALPPGTQGVINDIAIEETVRAIVQASVDRWSGFGAGEAGKFGITDKSPQVVLELADGKTVAATFGNSTVSNGAFVMVVLNGHTWIGEYPWILCRDIMAHLAPPQKRS